MAKSKMKDRIIRIAREKFFKLGFYKVSVDSLVAELRTSKSSIYNHFTTKDELVREVLIDVNDEINFQLEKILSDKMLSFYGKLAEITRFTGNLLESANDQFLEDLRIHLPDLWDEYLRMREDRINKYYKVLFRSGIEEGLIRTDIDLELIVQAYFKLTEISVRSNDFKNLELSGSEAYRQISSLFMEGIAKKE